MLGGVIDIVLSGKWVSVIWKLDYVDSLKHVNVTMWNQAIFCIYKINRF